MVTPIHTFSEREGIKIKTNALKKYRAELEAMQELNLACARIQSTFRSAFVRKANKKMERVARLLREKAWIARLNVRTITSKSSEKST